MADCIRRENALYAIQRQRGETRSPAQNRLLDLIRADIARVPAADVVEVVRCARCKYVRPAINFHTGEQVGLWCYLHDSTDVSPDDYCRQGATE